MEQLGQAGLKMTALQRECSTLKEELSTANSATQRAEEKLSAATDRVQELETALGDLRRLHDRVTSQDGILEPREQVVRLRDALDQQQEALRTSCDEALELKGHLTKLVRAFSSTAATVLSSAVLIELFREFEAETEEIGTSLNAGEAAGRLRDLSRVCAQIVNRGTSLGSLVPLCEELIFRLQDTCVTLGGELGELAHQHQSTREVAGDTISGLMDSLQSVSSEAKALMLSTRRMAKVVAVQALLQPHLGKARGDDFAERSAMSTPRGRQDHGRSGRSASPAPKKTAGRAHGLGIAKPTECIFGRGFIGDEAPVSSAGFCAWSRCFAVAHSEEPAVAARGHGELKVLGTCVAPEARGASDCNTAESVEYSAPGFSG
mmetsp:Transcript_12475/g.30625  ORF Transcript_12475/g.30625 Transcript_12475/m.30625 type:complete len:377 (-) Transcript_12475:48-1178(-)